MLRAHVLSCCPQCARTAGPLCHSGCAVCLCVPAGPLPASWSSLTSLQRLVLRDNALSGTLPAGWSALSRLTLLDLANNQLSSTVPSAWPTGMAGLTEASSAVLSGNAALCGALPGGWATSDVVTAGGSLLGQSCPSPPPPPPSPPLPPSPPPSPGNSLYTLRTAHSGAWPSFLTPGWDGVSDPCSPTVWPRVTCSGGVPVTLDLTGRNLTLTSLPRDLAFVTSLRDVRLGPGNALQGTLPAEWSALSALTRLDLEGGQQLTGTLPAEWSALGALRRLSLQGNQLFSTVPSAWASGMTALMALVFSNNAALCGPLPAGECARWCVRSPG